MQPPFQADGFVENCYLILCDRMFIFLLEIKLERMNAAFGDV